MTLNSHNRISIDSHIYEQDSVTEFLPTVLLENTVWMEKRCCYRPLKLHWDIVLDILDYKNKQIWLEKPYDIVVNKINNFFNTRTFNAVSTHVSNK